VTDEALPWESKTELTALVGLIAMLAASFGLFDISEEQITGLGALGFTLIMVVRYIWSTGALTFHKSS